MLIWVLAPLLMAPCGPSNCSGPSSTSSSSGFSLGPLGNEPVGNGSSSSTGYTGGSSSTEYRGCHGDAECAPGLLCIGGVCSAGCRTDVDCDTATECLCNACVARGCHSDDECPQGSFCPSPCDCQPKQCEPLPAPVECGGGPCQAAVVRGGFGDSVLGPCCADLGCGVDVGGFADSLSTCQRLGEPGTTDALCAARHGQFGTYPGCRRSDGQCGFDPGGTVGKTMAFGCLLAP